MLFLLDQDGPEPDDTERTAKAALHVSPQGRDGIVDIKGTLTPEAWAIYEAIFAKTPHQVCATRRANRASAVLRHRNRSTTITQPGPAQHDRALTRLQAETTPKELGAKSWKDVLRIRWRISSDRSQPSPGRS